MLRPAILALATIAVAGDVQADWEVRRDPFDPAVIARYKAILAKSPHDQNARERLAALYRRYRTFDKLVDEYRAAPETGASLVVLGLLERTRGHDLDAFLDFERAVAQRPEDSAAWRLVAQAREAQGRRIAAREAYERALEHATPAQEVPALRELITFVQASGDHDGEERYFTMLVAAQPKDWRVWVERGDAMVAAGRFDIARESFTAAEALLAKNPAERIPVIVRGARVLEKLGNNDAAMPELHRALAMVPRDSYALRDVVGNIIENRRVAKALPEAIAELEAMWPERTRKHFEWTTLAALYDETKDLPRAIVALEAAVARSPSETFTQLRLIEMLDRNQDTQQALQRMEALARTNPGDVALHLSLARRYGKFDDRAFRTLLALAMRRAKDPEALMAIVDMYVEWDRDDLAEAQLTKMIAAAPHDPAVLANIGEHALELGTFKAAAGAYLAATKLAPTDPALWTGLAFAYDGQRSWDSALETAEKVLTLIPDNLAHRADRRTARRNLVQILLRTRDEYYIDAFRGAWAWSFEQDNDLEAGYFLAIYYGVSPRDDEPFETLSRMHALVPDDEDITKDLDRARVVAREGLGLVVNRRRVVWTDLGTNHRSDNLDNRIGIHAGAGAGVRGDMPLTLTLGASLSLRIDRKLSFESRIDWTRRVGDLGSTYAVGASFGLSTFVKTTPQVALAVGAAERGEVRFGGEFMQTPWRRAELATEITTALVLRDAPFIVGTRFEAWYSGRVVGLLELGFEWR